MLQMWNAPSAPCLISLMSHRCLWSSAPSDIMHVPHLFPQGQWLHFWVTPVHVTSSHAGVPPLFSTWRVYFSWSQPVWMCRCSVCRCSVLSNCAALDGAPGGQPGQAAVGGRSSKRDALSDGIREQLEPLHPSHAESTLQPGKPPQRRQR